MSWSPRDLAVLVPMLGRAWTVAPLVKSLTMSVPGARVLFLVTPGDVDVCAEIDKCGCARMSVPMRQPGDYARKINIGYRMTSEPLLFTGACDLRFHPGWFEAATARMTPRVGVVGTNDLGNPQVLAGEHATHFLVSRWFADLGLADGQTRAIFCEQYPHEYVDSELIATARHRDVYAMASDSYVEHLHPHWGKSKSDDLYEQQPARMEIGKRIFNRRKHLWTRAT